MAARRFFDSSRRSRAPAVGLVARRGTGVTAARRIKSTRRSRASWRLRAWVRWRWASITSTPSRVSLLPARRSSRARTSSGRLGERRTSKRSSTALARLLTFCPPGRGARLKCSSSSRSAMLIEGVTRIIADLPRGRRWAASCRRARPSLTLRGFPIRRRFARFGEMAGRSSGNALGRGDALGAANDGDEETAVEQASGHALGIRERHGVDQAGAALDIVDAEIVDLHLHELARESARGVEAERKGALEIGLGLGEFRLGRSVLGEAADFALDDVDGLPGGIGARRRAA